MVICNSSANKLRKLSNDDYSTHKSTDSELFSKFLLSPSPSTHTHTHKHACQPPREQ